METKIETKREYVIILTQEEAEILYDVTDDLLNNVCDLLESEE